MIQLISLLLLLLPLLLLLEQLHPPQLAHSGRKRVRAQRIMVALVLVAGAVPVPASGRAWLRATWGVLKR